MQNLTRCVTSPRVHTGFSIKRLRVIYLLANICIAATVSTTASAAPLPLVTGVSLDGQLITWNAQDNATGYNVYRNGQYFATVTDGTSFSPDLAGQYQITAYDDNGNFSPLQIEGIPIDSALVDNEVTTVPPPQNVSGIIYFNVAGEIFWDRDPTRNLRLRSQSEQCAAWHHPGHQLCGDCTMDAGTHNGGRHYRYFYRND